MFRKIHPLVSLSVIVVLSLTIAIVLFGVLSSTGIVKNRNVEFGGAAAGFFASLYLIQKWYVKMEALASENAELRGKIGEMQIPEFELPANFSPYIDLEHSMMLAYPTEWRRQPLKMQIQSQFSEDPLALRQGDEFPGSFNFIVSNPGQQTYSLKEVALTAKRVGVSVEEVEQELGVELSERTESLQVPLEKLFSLLGAEGQTRREQIYDINYQAAEVMAEEVVRKDTELVDGRESLVVEWTTEPLVGETLVFFTVVTYDEDTDLIFTFTFVDNLSDRLKIDRIRKQVLSTVKIWKPAA